MTEFTIPDSPGDLPPEPPTGALNRRVETVLKRAKGPQDLVDEADAARAIAKNDADRIKAIERKLRQSGTTMGNRTREQLLREKGMLSERVGDLRNSADKIDGGERPPIEAIQSQTTQPLEAPTTTSPWQSLKGLFRK